ncbi:MAG: AAA family ATPase [Lewinellaceae bacterium]|nr:AAA family ATPase [Lewinellaceae bacterium]
MDWENINLNDIADTNVFSTPQWTEIIENLHQAPASVRRTIIREHSKTVLDRLHSLEIELNKRLILKEEIVRMMFVTAIAQQPMLLIGEPGTAKSLLVSKFCEGLGIGAISEGRQNTFFHYLLHKFTEPDELLGVINLEKLKSPDHPSFERLTEGTIKDAEVIFLDEVFKANSAILNTLLSILNERRVYEGGKIIKAKARLIFGAANEIPPVHQLGELKAFFERFTVRMKSEFVPYQDGHVKASEGRRKLLKEGWKAESVKLQSSYDPEFSILDHPASLNDLLLSTWIVTESFGGSESLNPLFPFEDDYHMMVMELLKFNKKICSIDDRKFIKLFVLARAHAFFRGNHKPDSEDLVVFTHIWNDIRNKELLEREVYQIMESIRQKHKQKPSKKKT